MKKITTFFTHKLSREEKIQLQEDRKFFIKYVVDEVTRKYLHGKEKEKILLKLSFERFVHDKIIEYLFVFKTEKKGTSINKEMAKGCIKKVLKEIEKQNKIPKAVFAEA